MSATIQRIRIYLSENDMWEGLPLYFAVMELFQREGATGVSVLQGIAGFGPGSSGIPNKERNAHAPVIIECIDRADFFRKVLPLLDKMIDSSLITIEPVEVHRAVLRSHGVFSANATVGDSMHATAQTITKTATLGKAVALMLTSRQSILPVVHQSNAIVGMLNETCFANRANLHIPLHLLRLLNKDEGNMVLAPIAHTPIQEIMAPEWRTVQTTTFIPQALLVMLEWGYDHIPVVDRDNTCAGVLSWSDILTAVIQQQADAEKSVQEKTQQTRVNLIMQYKVPNINNDQSLGEAIQQLFATTDRYLVVLNAQRTVVGTISDVSIFRALSSSSERMPLLQAIQQQQPISSSDVPGGNRSLSLVMDANPPTISPRETIINATRTLMELRVERAPVVDENGVLQGLVARGGLLRAIAQESK